MAASSAILHPTDKALRDVIQDYLLEVDFLSDGAVTEKLQYIEKILLLLEQIKNVSLEDKKILSELLREKAKLLQKNPGGLAEAHQIAEAQIAIFKKSSYDVSDPYNHFNEFIDWQVILGDIYRKKKWIDKALHCYCEALDCCQSIVPSVQNFSWLFFNMEVVYSRLMRLYFVESIEPHFFDFASSYALVPLANEALADFVLSRFSEIYQSLFSQAQHKLFFTHIVLHFMALMIAASQSPLNQYSVFLQILTHPPHLEEFKDKFQQLSKKIDGLPITNENHFTLSLMDEMADLKAQAGKLKKEMVSVVETQDSIEKKLAALLEQLKVAVSPNPASASAVDLDKWQPKMPGRGFSL